MLILISDLHLLDETAGRHNPSPDALDRVFIPAIASLARARGARAIRVVLLGDTFELIRSEGWLSIPPEERPWGSRGLADVDAPRIDSKTLDTALAILGRSSDVDAQNTIRARNRQILEAFRELGPRLRSESGLDIPVELVFVPGNHDRIVNVYPALRDEVASALGVTIAPHTVAGDPSGTWWYHNQWYDPEHGVFARHGHQFDPWNYGGGNDLTPDGHRRAPIGDLLGVEFGVKLPYRLALFREEHPEITPELVEFMKEMGLVRPFTHALQWLYFAIRRQDHGTVRNVLDAVFDDILSELLESEFVQTWRSPLTRLDDAARLASSRWLRWIPRTLVQRLDAEEILPFFAGVGGNPHDPDQDRHLIAAHDESIWRTDDRVHFVAYGHTHVPAQRPLDGENGREVLYLNTGTWRDSIFRTTKHDREPDFVKLQQMCYTVFWREDEDVENSGYDSVGVESWSGMRKIVRRTQRRSGGPS